VLVNERTQPKPERHRPIVRPRRACSLVEFTVQSALQMDWTSRPPPAKRRIRLRRDSVRLIASLRIIMRSFQFITKKKEICLA